MIQMSNMKRIGLREVTGATVLSGALRGADLLALLLREGATEPPAPQPTFLDFTGIEAATASFLRESIVAYRDIVRARRDSLIYPVIANANESVREDLAELLKSRGGVLMTCDLADDGTVSNPSIIGRLESKQQLTFDFVRKRGETDASELKQEFGENESVVATAWNNRLASLVALGLITESSFGRSKRYKPLLQGL
jgi:hypothetical protein